MAEERGKAEAVLWPAAFAQGGGGTGWGGSGCTSCPCQAGCKSCGTGTAGRPCRGTTPNLTSRFTWKQEFLKATCTKRLASIPKGTELFLFPQTQRNASWQPSQRGFLCWSFSQILTLWKKPKMGMNHLTVLLAWIHLSWLLVQRRLKFSSSGLKAFQS